MQNILFRFTQEHKNAPVMVALKHNWGWIVEAKDGSYYQEYCEQTHCAWCVKAEGLSKWSQKRGK